MPTRKDEKNEKQTTEEIKLYIYKFDIQGLNSSFQYLDTSPQVLKNIY